MTRTNPAHYTYSPIEPIDAIEAWGLGFRDGNVVKYIARAKHKGDEIGDLEKALDYLTRHLESRRVKLGQPQPRKEGE